MFRHGMTSQNGAAVLRILALSAIVAIVVAACGSVSPTAIPEDPSTSVPTATAVPSIAAPTPTTKPADAPTRVPTQAPDLTSTPAPERDEPTPLPTPTPTLSTDLELILAEVEAKVVAERGLDATPELLKRTVSAEQMAEIIAGLIEFDEEDEFVERIWIMLGLLEPEDSLIELFTGALQSQVIGFFLPEEGELVVLQDADGFGAFEEMTYAHEYTHALQHGAYDLPALEEAAKGDSEAGAALTALVEGDATLVQQRYLQRHLITRIGEILMALQDTGSVAEIPAPILETIIFPYQEGTLFVSSLFDSGGWEAIDSAYANPPRSTEHILHPQKYLAQDMPVTVTLPNVLQALGSRWDMKLEQTFGEFDLRLLLKVVHSHGDASQAAEGWGGDRFGYYTGPIGHELIVSHIAWDSDEDATEFFDSYGLLLDHQDAEDFVTLPDRITGTLREAIHTIRVVGDETLLIISTDDGAIEDVLSVFPRFLSDT